MSHVAHRAASSNTRVARLAVVGILPVFVAVSVTPAQAQASIGAEACGAASSGNGSIAATTIADFAWLQGTWRGEGPGGATAEVHYLAPRAGVIPSVFWLYGDERVMVLETVTLVEEDDGIMLYARHFTPSLVPWEVERALAQRLVAREGDRFTFENLYDEDPRCTVLERLGSDRFRAWSLLLRAGGVTDEIRVEYRRARRREETYLHPRPRGVFPPGGRRSIAALRRSILEKLFVQVIHSLTRTRAGP